jgi:hypothetical protein
MPALRSNGRNPTLLEATGFEPLIFGWALSEELVQWFRDPCFDAVREKVVRAAAAHCHRVWRHSQRAPVELRLKGQFTRRWLTAFFRHWLAAKLFAVAPGLAAQLPESYSLGHPLPSPHLAEFLQSR